MLRVEEAIMSDRSGNSFLWFLAGLGVGAVVGVLYAPRSGEETREVLRSKAEEGQERVRQQARRAREQAGDWIDRGRDVLNQQKEQFRNAYDAGRQAYKETTTAETASAQERLSKAGDRLEWPWITICSLPSSRSRRLPS